MPDGLGPHSSCVPKSIDDAEGLDAQINAHIIRTAQFIAQVDRKFLICRLGTPGEVRHANPGNRTAHCVVAIDQHAAHERIRVENILAELVRGFIHDDMKTSALPCDRTTVALTDSEADILEKMPSAPSLLRRWGMTVGILGGRKLAVTGMNAVELEVQTVPEVLANRFQGDPQEIARSVRGFLGYLRDQPVLDIWSQIAGGPEDGDKFRNITEQVALRLCPPRYRDLANSNACRGE